MATAIPWYRRKTLLGGLIVGLAVVAVSVYFGVEHGIANKSSSGGGEAVKTKSDGLVSAAKASTSETTPATSTSTTTTPTTPATGDVTNNIINADQDLPDLPLDTSGQPQGFLGSLLPGNNKEFVGANLWSAVSTQGGACYPQTGAQLAAMASSTTTCPLIVLTRGAAQPYTVRAPILITTPKVIVGVNPIDRATIDGSGAERVFHGEEERENKWCFGD